MSFLFLDLIIIFFIYCFMKIYFVDSFTDKAFKGNPAAVVILDKLLSDELMLDIAQEIGFSETAFLLEEKKERFSLRWFSPRVEVALCGHATLATAKIFFTYLQPKVNKIDFFTKYGKLSCFRENDKIQMDFPRDISNKIEIYNEIKDFFDFPIKDSIFLSEHNHYLTVFIADSIRLDDLYFDINKILELDKIVSGIRGLIISKQDNGKVQMRFFDPWEGIPEDPVTGSAALVVAEYWFEFLKSDYLEIDQLSLRGGKIFVKRGEQSLSIIGTATIILEGKIMVGKYGE